MTYDVVGHENVEDCPVFEVVSLHFLRSNLKLLYGIANLVAPKVIAFA